MLKNKWILINGLCIIAVSFGFIKLMPILLSIFVSLKMFLLPPDSGMLMSETPVIVDLRQDVISVKNFKSNEIHDFVFDTDLYRLGCDTIQNVKFWRSIMNLHKDSALFNTPYDRMVLCKTNIKTWSNYDLTKKSCYKDSLRNWYCLDDSARILLTNGKSFFYDFGKASQNFERGINGFVANGVDPWYAQAILMIESPNRLQKSNAGAYGSFQLMKDVARLFGLKVNKHIDERADFDRSAFAASSLIKKICIPKTKEILDSLGISNYNETDLWFRLLVMHAYHAGAGNLKRALFTFKPTVGDMNLIYTLWRTETKQFKSASQNYSQLVLAAFLEVNELFGLAPKPLNLPQSDANSETSLR